MKSALQSERDAAKNAKLELQKLQKQFEGIDPEIVKKVFAQIDQDEEAKLIAEGKVNEVIQKRTEKMREEHEKVTEGRKRTVPIKPNLCSKVQAISNSKPNCAGCN